MTVKRSGLGRNLSALLGTVSVPDDTKPTKIQTLYLSIDCLQPGKYQPRGAMDDASLQELSTSIQQQGLLQPLVVRELAENGRYEIIAGERRWRACQLAELTEVPVLLRQVDDETAMAMALIENLQREDLNPVDQAKAMLRLQDEFGLTHQQIADLLSKSRPAVSNFLRLLSLAPEVLRMLENDDLSMGHTKLLLTLDFNQQIQVARLIVAQNLSVRETEKLVTRVKNGVGANKKAQEPLISERLQNQIQHLSEQFQAKVNIKQHAKGKGSLVFHYNTDEDLQALLQKIIQ